MNRIVKLHFISLFVALMDFMLSYGAKISFRGQWLDIIVSILPIITCFILLSYFRKLILGLKIYIVIACLVSLLLSPLYFLATVAFPSTVYLKQENYELRQSSGVLGMAYQANIIRKVFIFEVEIAHSIDVSAGGYSRLTKPIHLTFAADSVGLVLAEKDTTLYFRK